MAATQTLLDAPGANSFNPVQQLAHLAGAPAEAIRLILTLLAGYLIAGIYRMLLIDNSSRRLHHLYFAACGVILCYFNYGLDTMHLLIGITTTYALISTLRDKPTLLLTANFIFHMTYLLVGYYCTASTGYDILWTMPQCILTLRMIALANDVVDGHRLAPDELSKDQKKTALTNIPSFLGLLAFAFFPSGFLVGPQFSYRRYQSFISGQFRKYEGFVQAGLLRLLVGLAYLAVRQVGALYLPDDYFLGAAYRNQSFLVRVVYLGLWGKISLYKYISCWLITEGALMCLGFTFNGLNEQGKPDWFGCSNVYLLRLETGYKMTHYIESFNVNTNHWAAQYVYKRLKFLNNRTISHGATLIFLAIWHGFHSGYYLAFLFEFIIVTAEKQIETLYSKSVVPTYGDILSNNKPLRYATLALLKSYNIICMGWCLIPFVFLKYARWLQVMSAVQYFGFICIILWLILHQIIKAYMRSVSRAQQDRIFGRAVELSPTLSSAGDETKED